MNKALIQILKEARISCGLKQSEVAQQLGIKDNTLSNWENGRTEPDIDTLIRMCGIYHLDCATVLNDAYQYRSPDDSSNSLSSSALEVATAYDAAPAAVQEGVRRFLDLPAISRKQEKSPERPMLYAIARSGEVVHEEITPEAFEKAKKTLEEYLERPDDID